jgi:trehalose 6-phosphate phosphatase
LATRLARIPVSLLVGNHGAETEAEPPPPIVRSQVRAWAAALMEAVEGDGIEVEDKGFSVAVHFRRAVAPELARRRILHLASVMPGARVFGGHAVVNLAPIGAPTKAEAIDVFAAQFPPGPLLFAGDDETDEDAFRWPPVTHGVRVGRSESTAARYFLEGQVDVERLLWALVSERARVAGLGDGWQDLNPSRNRGGLE